MWKVKLNFEKLILIIYITALLLSYFFNYQYMCINLFIVGSYIFYPYVMRLLWGLQYRIQKEVKSKIRNFKNENVIELTEEITKYYDETNLSIDELLSRKFQLEKNSDMDENILIGCVSGLIVSIIIYTIQDDYIREFFDPKVSSIDFTVGSITMGIYSLTVFSVFYGILYLMNFVPTKGRSFKSYIEEKELEILVKRLNERLEEKESTKECK